MFFHNICKRRDIIKYKLSKTEWHKIIDVIAGVFQDVYAFIDEIVETVQNQYLHSIKTFLMKYSTLKSFSVS